MKKKYFSIAVFLVAFVCAFVFYQQSLSQATYNGLPAVACIDPTQPIQQFFTLSITVVINGQRVVIPSGLGHDYAHCLRSIHVDSTNGLVMIQSNTMQSYTLADFFKVWHRTFTNQQIFQYQTGNGHTIRVLVNGVLANDIQVVPLLANEDIKVIYQ